MPHSLRVKLKGLNYKKIITDRELERLCKALDNEDVLDKIRTEITDCLKALDEIEKSGLNIYLPNEMLGRRLTYQQCLEFIDNYR